MLKLSPDIKIMFSAAEKAASRSLLRDFGEVEQLQVSRKGPADFVSAADKRAEEILHEELSKARPEYGFIMEESGSIKGKKDAPIFVIDPLDGTTNFLHGIPHWCISIAIVENGKSKAGIVYNPISNELFFAEFGKGAFIGNKRLLVSGRNKLNTAVISGGSPVGSTPDSKEYRNQIKILQEQEVTFRCSGSAALDLCYVAAGRVDGYWGANISIWDVAAGILIVQEAKGSLTSLNPNNKDLLTSGNLLASNIHLHKNLQVLLGNVQ